MPTLIDHANADFTIWESGAIAQYLVEKYDSSTSPRRLLPESFEAQARAKQWAAFQISEQGPYFGQAFWFYNIHAQKLPDVIQRYKEEVDRIFSVLEGVLATSQTGYLDGGNGLQGPSWADLMWVPWHWSVDEHYFPEHVGVWRERFPAVSGWDRRLNARKSVQKCLEVIEAKKQEKASKKQGKEGQ